MSLWSDYNHSRFFPDEDCLRFLSSVKDSSLNSQLIICDFGVGNGRNGQSIKYLFSDSRLIAIDKFLNGFHNSPFSHFYDETREDLSGISVDVVVDVMTSQHFHWHAHEEYFQLVHKALNPGGRFFLKHLNWKCSDTALAEPIDKEKFTYRNVPNVPGACYPANGLVCMPSAMALGCLLADVGFQIEKAYCVTRTEEGEEHDKVFAHSVLFCRKPK